MADSTQSMPRRAAKVTINFSALVHNANRVKHFAPNSKIIAVIKANAYGHGMLEVAKHLSSKNSPIDAFAVAMIGEAIELREAGVTAPIIVFHGFFNLDDLALMEQYDLQPVIHQLHQLDLLENHFTKSLDVWLKVDTGMHRLGFQYSEISNLLALLKENHFLKVESVFSLVISSVLCFSRSASFSAICFVSFIFLSFSFSI